MRKNRFLAGAVFSAAVGGAAYLAYKLYLKKKAEKAEDEAFFADEDDVCTGCSRQDCTGCEAFDEECAAENDEQTAVPRYEYTEAAESAIRKAAETATAAAKEITEEIGVIASKAVEEIKEILKNSKEAPVVCAEAEAPEEKIPEEEKPEEPETPASEEEPAAEANEDEKKDEE